MADWAQALTNVSHMNWEMIVGLSAVPWLKLVRSVCRTCRLASIVAYWGKGRGGGRRRARSGGMELCPARVTHRFKAELSGGPTWQTSGEGHAEVGAWPDVDSGCIRGGLFKISLDRSSPVRESMCSRKLKGRDRGVICTE